MNDCRQSITSDPNLAPDVTATFPAVGPTMTTLASHSSNGTVIHSTDLKNIQKSRELDMLAGLTHPEARYPRLSLLRCVNVVLQAISSLAVDRMKDIGKNGANSKYRVRHLCHNAVVQAGTQILDRMARVAPVALHRLLTEGNPWVMKESTGSFGAVMAAGATLVSNPDSCSSSAKN